MIPKRPSSWFGCISSSTAIRSRSRRSARVSTAPRRSAPDDDRVWLGKANLAIRAGKYDEAERWLIACIGRRPEDLEVWRARLKWAMATNRVMEVREALKHLPAAESTPAEVPRLAAWLARQSGDLASERHALKRVIAADPTDSAALDRLADLATAEGLVTDAAVLRKQKSEIERLHTRYFELHQRYQPVRDAAEMATLAERLGRRFEGPAFQTLAVAVNPDRHDLRRDLATLDQRERRADESGRTLAEALASELGPTTEATKPSSIRDSSITPMQPPRPSGPG